MEAASGTQSVRTGSHGRRNGELSRGRKLERTKAGLRESRSLSWDKRVVLDEDTGSGDALPSGIAPVDVFIIARLNDSSSYFFTWFCKRYRIRMGDQDVGGKLEILRCPICLDMCTKSIELQCGHAFCRPCLTTAAANNMTSCALCRREQVINPELLRAQFDERRMLNLAQRLSIPPPVRPRQPTPSASMADALRQKPDLSLEIVTKTDGEEVVGNKMVVPASPHAASMTARGHLLFGPWGDVGAMTPKELRRRWKVSNLHTSTLPVTFTADVGAASAEKLASSWRKLQALSRTSTAMDAVEHGLGSPNRASASRGSSRAERGGLSAYSWSRYMTSSLGEARGASGKASCVRAGASARGDPSVGDALVGELSTRWRALIRVPPATGFRRPSNVTPSFSLSGSVDFEPLRTPTLETEHVSLAVCTDTNTDATDVKFLASSSEIMTCQETVGSLASVDLRQRWNEAFTGIDHGVGTLAQKELTARLVIARGPQGAGGLSSAQLAERWLSTSTEYAEDRQGEGQYVRYGDDDPRSKPRLDGTLVEYGVSGVADATVTDTDLVMGTDKITREPRISSASNPLSPTSGQDVGAAPMSTLYTRWCAARAPVASSVVKYF